MGKHKKNKKEQAPPTYFIIAVDTSDETDFISPPLRKPLREVQEEARELADKEGYREIGVVRLV